MWILDGWNANEEGIKLDVDGVNFPLWSNMGASTSWNSPKCGNGAYKDFGGITLLAKVFHSASSLTLKFYSGLDADADTKSFGIKELKVRFATKSTGETESFCGYSLDHAFLAE